MLTYKNIVFIIELICDKQFLKDIKLNRTELENVWPCDVINEEVSSMLNFNWKGYFNVYFENNKTYKMLVEKIKIPLASSIYSCEIFEEVVFKKRWR